MPASLQSDGVDVLPVASKLCIIDGHALAYRMHFALQSTKMSTVQREPTHIVHGFLKKMLDLHTRFPSHRMLVAFDLPGPTFRMAELPTYKEGRPAMPSPLRAQLPLVQEACALLACPTLSAEGFEADDVIASCVREATAMGASDVVIVAVDKDLMQLVATDEAAATRVTMWNDKARQSVDAAAVEAKHGVAPAQMGDLLALMGDSSDSVPGVPGIGAKTAAKLLHEYAPPASRPLFMIIRGPAPLTRGRYGDLEGVLSAASSGAMKPSKRRTALVESIEIARRARRLVELASDAPVDVSLLRSGSLRFDHPGLGAFLTRWELNTIGRTIDEQIRLRDLRPQV